MSTKRSKADQAVEDILSPYEKVITAIEELNAQPECSMCGKRYEANSDGGDMCARCAADEEFMQ